MLESTQVKTKMQNPKSKIQNAKGFSLIELVFAMSFITIIIFGVISLQSSNLAMLSSQNNEIQAHFYANQGIQILKAIEKANITSGCVNGDCKITKIGQFYGSARKANAEDKEDIDGLELYYRDFTWSDTNLIDTALVTVKITWEDSTGPHSVSAKQIIQ